MLGGDGNRINIISHTIHPFFLDVLIENKIDNSRWQVTVVYGPVLRNLKKPFRDALTLAKNLTTDLWLVCGDFNAIRKADEKTDPNFDVSLSRLFNKFVNTHHLIEHKLHTRKYTWSNGTRFALLDRIFISITWDQKYTSSHIQDLSSIEIGRAHV